MFIAIEFVIYISYLYLDITHNMIPLSSLLKFFAICLCFLMVSGTNHPVRKIMSLTVAADFLLVITPFYSLGIFFFILVQLNYYSYITKKARFPLDHLTAMVIAGFIVSILINFFVMPINFMTFLAVVYFITLVTNIVLCLMQVKGNQEYAILTICLILIMLCDIHVAITNVLSSGAWYNFGLIAMWLFYLPSQVIIAQLYSTNSLIRRYPL